MQTHIHNETVHMLSTYSRIPILLQLYTYEQFLINFITSTNLELLYTYGANQMLLCIAPLLTYSKRKQCNCQDTNSDVQQCNIHTTNNHISIILLLNSHYMPANSYCSVLHQTPANVKKQYITNLAYLHTTSWPTGKATRRKTGSLLENIKPNIF